MNLRAYLKRKQILAVFVSALILCSITLSYLNLPMVSAAKPKIIITHSLTELSVGENFTTTLNLTDVPNLRLFQVVVKYNGTVLNLTKVWFPDSSDFVFWGQNPLSVWESDIGPAGDLVDHLNYTEAGSTLLTDTSISVSNGTLCKLNFTVIRAGPTNFTVATLSNPVHSQVWNQQQMTWVSKNFYTFYQVPGDDVTEYTDFDISGQSQTPPPPADNTMLIIEITAVVVVVVIAGIGVFVWRRRRDQTQMGSTSKTSDTSNTVLLRRS